MERNNIIVKFHFSGERRLTFSVHSTAFGTRSIFLERLFLIKHWHASFEQKKTYQILSTEGRKKVEISQEIPACVPPAEILP